MRIGIDGRYQGQPFTGIPRYIDELCKQLDALLPDAQFFLYATNAEGIRVPSTRWTLRIEPNRWMAKVKPTIWWKFFAARLIRKDSLNVFWAASGLLPGRVVGLRYVLTVHDLTFRLHPQTMPFSLLWSYRLFFKADLLRADCVVAVSAGTSDKLYRLYKRRVDALVRPDASPHFSPRPAEQQCRIRSKYGLQKPYLLAVSTLEPRKNLSALIDAFVWLKKSGLLPQHELVLIGKRGWKTGALSQSITAANSVDIRSLGFVPDEDLPALYSACDLFCMPSLYEGFGIPVLEAVRCGARVIASDIPELREAGGTHCIYIDPTPSKIAQAILNVVNLRTLDPPNASIGIRPWFLSATALKTAFLSQYWKCAPP